MPRCRKPQNPGPWSGRLQTFAVFSRSPPNVRKKQEQAVAYRLTVFVDIYLEIRHFPAHRKTSTRSSALPSGASMVHLPRWVDGLHL